MTTYFLAIAAGIAGAAAGWFLTGIVAVMIAGLFGMSNFEGGRAMFAFWGIAPFGGIIGLIAGILLVLRYQGKITGFRELAGRSVMIVGAIAGLTVLGILLRLYTLPDLERPLPRVVFEIRLPANVKIPDRKAVRITLDTDKNQTDALLETQWLTQEAGRPVLHGFVDLYKRTTNRLLVLRIEGEPDRLFTLKLWGNPGPMKSFTDWEQVEYISEGSGLRRAEDADKYEFRFRVERESGTATPLYGNATGLGGKK